MGSKIFSVMICLQILIFISSLGVMGDNPNDTGSQDECDQSSEQAKCKTNTTGQICSNTFDGKCQCPEILVNITRLSNDDLYDGGNEKSNHIFHNGKCVLKKNWLCPFPTWNDNKKEEYFKGVTCQNGMKCVNGSSVFPILKKLKDNKKIGVCGADRNSIAVGVFMIIIIHSLYNLNKS